MIIDNDNYEFPFSSTFLNGYHGICGFHFAYLREIFNT